MKDRGDPRKPAGTSKSDELELPKDGAGPLAPCQHPKTNVIRSFNGDFMTVQIVCESCGMTVRKESVTFGHDMMRCPVDPFLDQCLTSCPVEAGSASVFEHPCEPVRKLLEAAGYIGPNRRPKIVQK